MEIERNNPENILDKLPENEPSEKETKQDIRKKAIILITNEDTYAACYTIATYLLDKYYFITIQDTNEIYVYIEGVYLPVGAGIIAQEVQSILQDYCAIHLVNEILGHVKRLTIRRRSELAEPADKICLQNGIVDLNTLQIVEHDPKIVFFNKLPVSFVSGADCPKIKKFLAEIVDKESITLLQEFAGYCLYKDYFIHKAFMLVGGGANGKSTYLQLLKAFLGAENISSISLHTLENNRFSLSSLFGKLANTFADLPSRDLKETSAFKMLVGQDSIRAEKKFRDEFFFTNYAKLIFSANQIPKSPEDTDAFFRRWAIIVFPNQFLGDKANKHLIKELTTAEELSGFLNFAIEGLRRLLEKGDFSINKSVEQVRDQYIRISDSVGAFNMDKILILPDKYVVKKELYLAYCDYCRGNGYPIEAENTFHRELIKKIRVEDYRPLLNRNGKQERVQCWRGIGINPDKADDPDKKDVNPVKDVGDKILSDCGEEELKITYEKVN